MITDAQPAGADFTAVSTLPPALAEALLRVVETGPGVRRRSQLFLWLQNQVHALMPHVLAVCGAWRRQLRDLDYEVFHGVVLDEQALHQLTLAGSPAMRLLAQRWMGPQARPQALPLAPLRDAPDAAESAEVWAALLRAGLGHLVVHGVARPERPREVETLFVFGRHGSQPEPGFEQRLELLLPHLHAAYLRVRATEHDLNVTPPRATAAAPVVSVDPGRWQITDRERQILYWVRQGMSNHQIGGALGISGLTVKNHVQKILRKMGATNRAHAVSLAISADLLKGVDTRRKA